jgi:hypothetical protein
MEKHDPTDAVMVASLNHVCDRTRRADPVMAAIISSDTSVRGAWTLVQCLSDDSDPVMLTPTHAAARTSMIKPENENSWLGRIAEDGSHRLDLRVCPFWKNLAWQPLPTRGADQVMIDPSPVGESVRAASASVPECGVTVDTHDQA